MSKITSRTTTYFSEKRASPTNRAPSKWAPSCSELCLHAPMNERTVITARMINAICVGCNVCCTCAASPEAMTASKSPLPNQPNSFTYHVKHSVCIGCGLYGHKKIYDLSRVSIPLSVSFDFHNKCCEYIQRQPHLSNTEIIEMVLTFFAPPSTLPLSPLSAKPSTWKACGR